MKMKQNQHQQTLQSFTAALWHRLNTIPPIEIFVGAAVASLGAVLAPVLAWVLAHFLPPLALAWAGFLLLFGVFRMIGGPRRR
jgi:fatty acid desaturase